MQEQAHAMDKQARIADEQVRVAEQQSNAIIEQATVAADQTRVMEAQTLAMQEQARAMDKHAQVNEARARAIEGRLDVTAESLDEKLAENITGLARLVRSDNVTLAEQISAGQAATKQTLRALKELQANLPGDMIELVEQRLSSLAETIERSNETLAKRIDMVADTIGRRQATDLQVVIDRMGDAMHALASLGRIEPEPQHPPRRIDLE
jgi:hypothetical protein